jgi:hypothetical protein
MLLGTFYDLPPDPRILRRRSGVWAQRVRRARLTRGALRLAVGHLTSSLVARTCGGHPVRPGGATGSFRPLAVAADARLVDRPEAVGLPDVVVAAGVAVRAVVQAVAVRVVVAHDGVDRSRQPGSPAAGQPGSPAAGRPAGRWIVPGPAIVSSCTFIRLIPTGSAVVLLVVSVPVMLCPSSSTVIPLPRMSSPSVLEVQTMSAVSRTLVVTTEPHVSASPRTAPGRWRGPAKATC